MDIQKIFAAHFMMHLQIAIALTDALSKSLKAFYDELEKQNPLEVDTKATEENDI